MNPEAPPHVATHTGVSAHRANVANTFAGETQLDEGDAERAAAYVVEAVRATSRHLFHQGPRRPRLPCAATSPALRFVAEERMHRIALPVARALVAWGNGFPVHLLERIPTAEEVLLLQARGQRCVSVLPAGVPTSPHDGPLDFTLHDLCHLDKFIDPEHHVGQVGFFATLERAVATPIWTAWRTSFDDAFRDDWHHVAADMNGSSIFLMAALKMKLKMAVRRRLAAEEGRPPPHGGPLSDVELRIFSGALDDLLATLELSGDVADAARRSSTRRDDPLAARTLLAHFEDRGRGVLESVNALRR